MGQSGMFRFGVASALALAFVAAVMLISPNEKQGDMSVEDWFGGSPEALAEVKAKAAASPANSALSAAALQKLERIHVMKCAKKITGSDKPRKLAPEIRDKVLKCANGFMPPVQTKALLAASAKELMSAAKTPAQKKDAQAILAKSVAEPKTAKSAAVAKVASAQKKPVGAPKAAVSKPSVVAASKPVVAGAPSKQAAAARIAAKAAKNAAGHPSA